MNHTFIRHQYTAVIPVMERYYKLYLNHCISVISADLSWEPAPLLFRVHTTDHSVASGSGRNIPQRNDTTALYTVIVVLKSLKIAQVPTFMCVSCLFILGNLPICSVILKNLCWKAFRFAQPLHPNRIGIILPQCKHTGWVGRVREGGEGVEVGLFLCGATEHCSLFSMSSRQFKVLELSVVQDLSLFSVCIFLPRNCWEIYMCVRSGLFFCLCVLHILRQYCSLYAEVRTVLGLWRSRILQDLYFQGCVPLDYILFHNSGWNNMEEKKIFTTRDIENLFVTLKLLEKLIEVYMWPFQSILCTHWCISC